MPRGSRLSFPEGTRNFQENYLVAKSTTNIVLVNSDQFDSQSPSKMELPVLQAIITAQSAALATTCHVHTVLADTVNILIEDNENEEPPVHGGSRPGRHPNLERDFEDGYQRLYKDYLAPQPIYGDHLFRRRFCMHRDLFTKIVDDVTAHD
ncbi:hypothetical protein PSTG_18785, partial [Puccinia striiformis f. sp. tritici PST-78]